MSRTADALANGQRAAMRDIQRTATPAAATRIAALDFTKGALVVFMVVYHWINYFIGLQWPHYQYLRFLTPSFIFIAGFMISNVYLSKYDASDPRLARRLFGRGLKLIAIFLVLNVARMWLLPILSHRSVAPALLDSRALLATFVTGDFTSKVVAFYVLVPIAYLLMLSAPLMLSLRVFRYSFHAACLILFGAIAVLDVYGRKGPNLEMVAIGMLGLLAGFSPISAINRAIQHPYALVSAYFFYTIAITAWGVPYPLEVVGTCLSVMIIYLVGTMDGKLNRIRDEVSLLGKYSLWGYISQIVILQFLQAGFRHLSLGSAGLAVSFAAALTLTVIAVEIVHRGRSKAEGIDTLYRAVFG